jgi:two-component sensor histidine kinase
VRRECLDRLLIFAESHLRRVLVSYAADYNQARTLCVPKTSSGDDFEFGWENEAEPRLELIWREHGGPPVSAPPRRGFGSLLLEQCGEVVTEFRPEGLVCSITARLR